MSRQLEAALDEVASSKVQVVIFNGGTGLSRRDMTFEVRNASWTRPGLGSGKFFAC